LLPAETVLHSSFLLINTSPLSQGLTILQEIKDSPEMQQLWSNYQKKYDYASGIAWEDTIIAAKALLNFVFQDYAPS
jgi:hypothetical protein